MKIIISPEYESNPQQSRLQPDALPLLHNGFDISKENLKTFKIILYTDYTEKQFVYHRRYLNVFY